MSEGIEKSVVNRGKRNITLRPHPDGRPRVLEPGKSIECLDDKEFKLLTGYHDIADVDKIAPQLAQRESKLRADLAKAEAENKKLRAQKGEPVVVVSEAVADEPKSDENLKHPPEPEEPKKVVKSNPRSHGKKKGK